MLSIILSNNHTPQSLATTLKSISASKVNPEMLEIKVLDFVKDEEEQTIDRSQILQGYNISFADVCKKEKAEIYAQTLNNVKGNYVIFANSGDIFTKGFFNLYSDFIKNSSNQAYPDKSTDVVAFKFDTISYEETEKYLKRAKKFCCRADISAVDLNFTPDQVITDVVGVLFSVKALKKVGINKYLKNDALKNALFTLLNDTESYISIKNIAFYSPYPLISDKVNYAPMHEKCWYYDSLRNFVLPMVKNFKTDGITKVFIQYVALNELKWRYVYNQNSDNKHLTDDNIDEFLNLCREILSEVDNNVIFNSRNAAGYNMPKGLCFALFDTKYGVGYKSDYVFDNRTILRQYDDVVLMRASALRVILEVLEYENGKLTMEASIDDFMDMNSCELKCYLDNEEVEITPTYRYAHTKFFGISTNKRYTFRIEIPESRLSDDMDNVLNFYICYKGFSIALPFTTRKYTSKVSTGLPYSYWKFGNDNRAVYFDKTKKSLVFSRISGFGRFKREIKMLSSMLHGSNRSITMFVTRLLYWLTRPYFRNKRIWLTYDKLYKGGDCGEYFYKYMKSQNDGITPAYVINRDTEDRKRLRKEGYKPLIFGTMKTRLYYINSEVVFATHGGTHTFCGITNAQAKYVSDLLFAEVTCIQHGLSVQQLAQELNKVYNNTKRYYCASKYEIKNLEHRIYGYEDKSALRLTGIPRFDGLISDDKKQILITPTWRAYISMPPVMGQSRPYYPEFKNTNYFKIYHQLLTDEKLINTARKTGYKLIYLLHPIISSQIVDYPEIDGVEIIPATTVNYEKILTESSLMLTDYSGVQFDFAYMRKPVVYYHPPKLPPHYKEGGFFYDSMGFGEICTEHNEMVDCLCEYMENNCEMKPFYKDRADDFFAFSDQDSCKRIYDDMTEYLKAKKTK